MAQENRVVVLIDMDCFYCQVEEKLSPELRGQPIAVVQYNPWKGGGIIAVNYVARARGVTRHMRGDEAKEKCPEIQLPSVPCLRGKADISKYRDAGKEVAKVLQKFTSLLERASIDEAYLDITAPVHERLKTLNVNTVTTDLIPNTYALGYESIEEFIADVHNYGCESLEFDYEHAKELLVGAVIVSEIRAAVYEETGYRCSAGIAHNKILAKLVCGMNKPNKQTILPKHSVNMLYSTLSLKKVKHLGGKFGDTVCKLLRIKNMSELQQFTEKELQNKFDEKNGTWLYNIARGIDLEPVQARFNPKSIGCCKQFKGKAALVDFDSLKKWLTDLGDEIDDRLEKDALENNRTPKQMVVSFSTCLSDGRDVSSSRSYNFNADDEMCGEFFSKKALDLVMETTEGVKLKGDEGNRRLKSSIKFLGISVGKFEDTAGSKKTRKIVDVFSAGSSRNASNKTKDNELECDKNIEYIKKNSKNVEGKELILQKFFQVPNKPQNNNLRNNISTNDIKEDIKEKIVESTLEKQESFFARFLNKDTAQFHEKPCPSVLNNDPTTPVCDILNCGEDSNDTEYSSSTINNEINKSIALFEDDPQDANRISSIRQLLTSTMVTNEIENNIPTNPTKTNEIDGIALPEIHTNSNNNTKSEHCFIQSNLNQIECHECGKSIDMDKLDEHADYHVALKLRDEERLKVRMERKETNAVHNDTVKKKKNTEISKNIHETSSIASFLVKIDESSSTEMCSECGKRVPVEKLPEHLDFHEAQKLSREINRKQANSNEVLSNSIKRKRNSSSPVKKPKVPCKSIASFFNR